MTQLCSTTKATLCPLHYVVVVVTPRQQGDGQYQMTFCRSLPAETFSRSLFPGLPSHSPLPPPSLFPPHYSTPSNPKGRQTVCKAGGGDQLFWVTHMNPLQPARLHPTPPAQWGGPPPPPHPLQASMAEGSFPELATKNSWSTEAEVGEGMEANSFQMCQGTREPREPPGQWSPAVAGRLG